MQFLIVLLPLLGFLGGSLLGRFFGRGTAILTTSLTGLAGLLSLYNLADNLANGTTNKIILCNWLTVDSLSIDWCFYFDTLTAIMLVVVTFISSLVHLYSTEYMENDPHLPRFMSYLSLFTFFMLILVTGGNFMQMFVGWEGVGVSSYLLINFWFTRIQANKAAIKAMIVNRVGDFFILLGMFAIYLAFNSLDYDVVFNTVINSHNDTLNIGPFEVPLIDFICVCLLGGAMGKSAQIGLHTWLPDAMEGPTPVSALIHAATMVTAGVFLIARTSYLFEHSPFALTLVTIVGSTTAFFAATTGLFQNDIKKVIAYSTCSQLGYMVFACGLSGYEVGIFHLSNHAFFKALLFLAAGSVIHAVGDEQDMRRMGGLKNLLPFTYSVIAIGSLALIGFPFLAGFYSKDIILEVAGSTYTAVAQYAFCLGLLAAFCTAFYSTRLLYLVFLAKPNANKHSLMHAHEPKLPMATPLVILAVCSIVVGFVSKEAFIGFGNSFLGSAVYIKPEDYTMLAIEFLPLQYKLLPLILTLLGVATAYIIYAGKIEWFYNFKLRNIDLVTFFNKKWYFDRIYSTFIVQPLLTKGYSFFYQTIDRGLIEQLGPVGISNAIYGLANNIRFLQSGSILSYLMYFTVAILASVVYLLY